MFEKLKLLIGAGLSSNYKTEKFDFTIGCWKVYDAVHKNTNKRVSLWILDHEFLDKRFPNKADQTPYINGYITCINNSRKLVHPHLLRIHEAQLDSYYLEFTSEHVTSCLKTHVGKLDSNDASYIAFQLLDALSFLHNTTKKVHFGVSTSSIFLDENFNAKLFNFNWLSDIGTDNNVKPPFSEYDITPAYPNIKYTAPEVILGKPCMAQTDIFSFGAVFCELLTGKQLLEIQKKDEYKTTENPIANIQGMTTHFYQLLSNCLQPSPTLRPTTVELLKDQCFNTVSVKILRYLDMIVIKDPKDKLDFFRGLPKVINGFSQHLLEVKIIPLLVEECRVDKRFAPVLLPTIFQAGKYFNIETFTNKIFNKVEFLIPIQDPPEILIAFLQYSELLLENTDESIHEQHVIPIFSSSLKSEKEIVLREAIKKLRSNSLIPKISINGIQKSILPLLIKICSKQALSTSLISSSIECIKICLQRVDHDLFLKFLMPKIYDVWLQRQDPLLVPPLADLLLALKGTETPTMSYAMPLGAELVSSQMCHPYYAKIVISWMLAAVTKYQTAKKLDQVEDPPQNSSISEASTTVSSTIGISEAMEFFDPLAEELHITPAQQNFDFTFSTGQLSGPTNSISSSSNQKSFDFNFDTNKLVSNTISSDTDMKPSFGQRQNSNSFSAQNNFNDLAGQRKQRTMQQQQAPFNPNFDFQPQQQAPFNPNFDFQPQQQQQAPFNPDFPNPTVFAPDFSSSPFNQQFQSQSNSSSKASKNDLADLF